MMHALDGLLLSLMHNNVTRVDFLIFHTPQFLHSSFSTLLIFYTPYFPHSSFSTLLIFHTPHFLHSSFSTLLIFYTPHSALRTPHSALRTPHSALRTPHSALRTPHSALRTPHSALRTPHSALRTPHSALRTPHSALPVFHLTVSFACFPWRSRLWHSFSCLINRGIFFHKFEIHQFYDALSCRLSWPENFFLFDSQHPFMCK